MRISDWSSDLRSSDRRLGKSEEAAGCFDQARFLLTQVGDRIGEAHALYVRGELYRQERNPAAAQNRFERALTLYRRTGEYVGEALVRLVMSDGYRKMQRPTEAREKIGRASCRERVCQYVEISVVAVSLKTQN